MSDIIEVLKPVLLGHNEKWENLGNFKLMTQLTREQFVSSSTSLALNNHFSILRRSKSPIGHIILVVVTWGRVNIDNHEQ